MSGMASNISLYSSALNLVSSDRAATRITIKILAKCNRDLKNAMKRRGRKRKILSIKIVSKKKKRMAMATLRKNIRK